MTLTLYTNPMSRGQIARWMLEETGAPYGEVILGYQDSMKAPEYLAINPMGKVPALVHDGQVVTEGAAICAYLAGAFPDARLGPQDDAERAAYYRWLFFAAGPVEAAITDKFLGVEVSPEQQRMAGYGTFDTVVDVLDQAVGARDYVCGDRFTAADVYFGSQIIWGVMFGTLPKRDSFQPYVDRLTARAAYKAAKAKDEALMPKKEGCNRRMTLARSAAVIAAQRAISSSIRPQPVQRPAGSSTQTPVQGEASGSTPPIVPASRQAPEG